ncbi:hypothetical protein ATO12_17135 [Aquimarina atlantica]|uniref:Uncharacterized protein n=1 Tax=Aquimarina atlantica TaxID=1317122 RepID=A0A023BUL8_9FLAO|nr:hypothetical protein [Aquimarina atlantica]EZH73660.1 hypothetical protein ATO12_17135 [Aquimarina atlantica]
MKLYKCECQNSSGKTLKGMNVEVITSIGDPKSEDIKKAVERKYGVSLSSLSINLNQWDCILIS